MLYLDSDSPPDWEHLRWQHLHDVNKSDCVFDLISAIVASMFGAGETIEEILEEE